MNTSEARLTVPRVAVATADREGTQVEIDVEVVADGTSLVILRGRASDADGYDPPQVLLTFDDYEWARIKKAVAVVDELKAKIEAGGAFFRVG